MASACGFMLSAHACGFYTASSCGFYVRLLLAASTLCRVSSCSCSQDSFFRFDATEAVQQEPGGVQVAQRIVRVCDTEPGRLLYLCVLTSTPSTSTTARAALTSEGARLSQHSRRYPLTCCHEVAAGVHLRALSPCHELAHH